MHLGLLGAAVAASMWARWAGNILIAVIALKVIMISVHLLLGRFAIGRGLAWRKTFADRRKHRRSPPDSAPTAPGVAEHTARTVNEEHP